MTSKLVVNTIEADTGISSVSFASSISLSSSSVFHLGDAGINIGADTNINRAGNGVLGFNINSSEKARITSAGNVGIGTDNPSANYRVTIKSSTSPHSALLLDTSESNYNTNLYFAKQATNKWIIGNKASDDAFRFVSGSDERFRIGSGGQIGLNGANYGTSGQVLTSQGSGAAVQWATPTAPLKTQFYKSSNDAQSTFSSLTRIIFTTVTYTAVQSGSTISYEASISGELDSNRGNSFYMLYYSTDNFSSATNLPLNECMNGGSGGSNDGTFNDKILFYFTNPTGTTETKYALYYIQSGGGTTHFNQQGLTDQPSGSSNYSYFKITEYAP